MDFNKLTLVNGIGWLDWEPILGQKTSIAEINPFDRVLNPDMMNLFMGLALSAPINLVFIIREIGLIEADGRYSVTRTYRSGESGKNDVKILSHFFREKLPPEIKQFFFRLMKQLNAYGMTYNVHATRPQNMLLTIKVPKQKIRFPSEFMVKLVHDLNNS